MKVRDLLIELEDKGLDTDVYIEYDGHPVAVDTVYIDSDGDVVIA